MTGRVAPPAFTGDCEANTSAPPEVCSARTASQSTPSPRPARPARAGSGGCAGPALGADSVAAVGIAAFGDDDADTTARQPVADAGEPITIKTRLSIPSGECPTGRSIGGEARRWAASHGREARRRRAAELRPRRQLRAGWSSVCTPHVRLRPT